MDEHTTDTAMHADHHHQQPLPAIQEQPRQVRPSRPRPSTAPHPPPIRAIHLGTQSHSLWNSCGHAGLDPRVCDPLVSLSFKSAGLSLVVPSVRGQPRAHSLALSNTSRRHPRPRTPPRPLPSLLPPTHPHPPTKHNQKRPSRPRFDAGCLCSCACTDGGRRGRTTAWIV
ncbi:hypothetical protein BJY59DRAFT_375912 [Rhodotorula toruloides]